MITENLSTLKIHKLTQEQYDRKVENGNIDKSALYLTPDDAVVSIKNGGTGATNSENAVKNLGLGLQEGNITLGITGITSPIYHTVNFYRQGYIAQMKGEIDILSFLPEENNMIYQTVSLWFYEGSNYVLPTEDTYRTLPVYTTNADGVVQMYHVDIRYLSNEKTFIIHNLPSNNNYQSAILHFDVIYILHSLG